MDEEAAQSTKDMWALGNYSLLAERLVPAAEQIAATVGDGAGKPAADVAAGTGSLALALARRGWSVSATDIAPVLVDIGRQRVADAGADVEWHEAGLDEIPLPDRSVDLVGSSFGLIFAPDPAHALDEAQRLLRPGGTLAFSAWTPSSYIAEMTRLMARFMPPGPQMDGPFRWGDPAATRPWLAGRFTDVSTTTHTLPWSFPSAAAATDFMFEHSPGHVAAFAFAGSHGEAMRTAVRDHLTELAEHDGSVNIAAEYIVTTARCP